MKLKAKLYISTFLSLNIFNISTILATQVVEAEEKREISQVVTPSPVEKVQSSEEENNSETETPKATIPTIKIQYNGWMRTYELEIPISEFNDKELFEKNYPGYKEVPIKLNEPLSSNENNKGWFGNWLGNAKASVPPLEDKKVHPETPIESQSQEKHTYNVKELQEVINNFSPDEDLTMSVIVKELSNKDKEKKTSEKKSSENTVDPIISPAIISNVKESNSLPNSSLETMEKQNNTSLNIESLSNHNNEMNKNNNTKPSKLFPRNVPYNPKNYNNKNKKK